MAMVRSVIFSIIGIVAVGWVLAAVAPPHWVFGELFLLMACFAIVRECLISRQEGSRLAGSNGRVTSGTGAWFSRFDTPGRNSQAFYPFDFEQPAAKPRTTREARIQPVLRTVNSDRQSIEQIAHEMLMQAFRHASQKHHPDHGGDPEEMRRVYAARDMILRAIHKP
jgi:hypothetical protein